MNLIPEGKRIIGDSGMRGKPTKISTTKPGHSKEVKKFFAREKSRQETLFLRMIFFDVLKNRFRHEITLHKMCLEAVAVIVQYGKTLWYIFLLHITACVCVTDLGYPLLYYKKWKMDTPL